MRAVWTWRSQQGIEVINLSDQAPEFKIINSLEDLWHALTGVVPADQADATFDELTGWVLSYLSSLPDDDCLRLTGLPSSSFDRQPR